MASPVNQFIGFNTTQAKTLQRLAASEDSGLAALAVTVTNLNNWAIALATKINVLTTKLNADAGVTDTNYATNFDIDPQT